jgi:hypothetical protein
MQNLNSLTPSVRELSRIRTDGRNGLISPKAGLKIDTNAMNGFLSAYRKRWGAGGGDVFVRLDRISSHL